MRALAFLIVAPAFAAGIVANLSACGPHCNDDTICAVEGQAGDSTGVCDGSDFVQCDDGHRGATIFCGNMPRKAICGAGGWSFEYAPLPK